MQRSIIGLLKFCAVWAAILIGSIVGTIIVGVSGDATSPGGPLLDGPLSGGPFSGDQAFLLVNALHAVILSVIASRSRRRGLALAALIAVTLFAAQSFLLQMETLFFMDSVNIPLDVLLAGVAVAFSASVFAGAVSAVLWRSPSHGDEPPLTGLPLRIALVSALYVGVYFVAGYVIAWSADAVRDYYSDGAGIDLAPLLAFQLLRGALWGILALYIALSLTGPVALRMLIVSAAFSILASAQLLYPNAYMPWPVRAPHLIEVSLSNFLFGALAVWIFLAAGNNQDRVARKT